MHFSDDFAAQFETLLRWRRDVRHFRRDPIPQELLHRLIGAACLAPSVGLSQPWRFVQVIEPARRAAIVQNFKRCNAAALAAHEVERAALYARLKLAGLDDAPLQLAVFAETEPDRGSGLGRATMPEMVQYSVVTAVHTLWLFARVHGLGVGWVSIIDPDEVKAALEVPQEWALIAYLCIGWPAAETEEPLLQSAGWEKRADPASFLYTR